MALSAAHFVHASFLTEARYHAQAMTLLLGYAINALEQATAEGSDRTALDDIANELKRLRPRATVDD